MNQNKDIFTHEIKIPELPDDHKPKKKRSKLPLIIISVIILVLIIAATIPAYILLDPIMQTTHWENTLNEVFFDTAELDAFSSALSEGARADVSVELEKSLTGLLRDISLDLSIVSKLTDDKDSGNMTFSLTGGAKTLALSIVYDETTAALGIYEFTGGVVGGDIEYLSFPRHGLADAVKTSVFAPDSGTKYALDKEIFDEVISYLETFEIADESYDVEALETSLQKVSNEIISILEPSSRIYFADGAFELCREIGFSATGEELRAIMNIIADEADANKDFAALMGAYCSAVLYEYGGDRDFAAAVRRVKNEISDCEVAFSYVIRGDYVIGLNFSYKDLVDSENSFDADLEFVYTEETNGFDINITYENTDAEKVFYRKETTADENSISITVEADGEIFEAKGVHNTADESLIITAKTNADSEEFFELRGSCKYDKATAELSLSFSSVKIGTKDAIEGFEVEVYLGKYDEEIIIPESHPLFVMGADELDSYIKRLPTDAIGDIVKSCTGKELESFFSADGQLMLDADQYTELATSYANAYSEYLSKTEIMRADAVYIPVPELEINVLLYYDKWKNMIYYNFAYNMTNELLASYHIASFGENGELLVHNIVTEKDQAASCLVKGERIYSCTICGLKHTEGEFALGHSFVDFKDSVITHLGKEISCTVRQCSRCGYICNVFAEGYCTLYLDRGEDGSYTLKQYDIDYGNSGDYFYVPKPKNTEINITDMKDADKYGFAAACVVIPEGVSRLDTGEFKYAHCLQVLIIPSTVTEIKENAFVGAKNLRTIYYCGTEEQWKKISLGTYSEEWSDVKVVFCPKGINPWEIKDKLLLENKLYDAEQKQKKLTQSLSSAKKAANHDKVSLVDSGIVRFAAYDEESGLLAVCGAYENSKTEIRVYDAKTMKLSFSFKIDDDIHSLDIGEGYIALASKLDTIFYVRSLADGATERVEFGDKYSSNRNWTTQIFIDCGYIYACEEDQHCDIIGYSIKDKTMKTFGRSYEPYLIFIPEKHRIISLDRNSSTSRANLIDTEKCELIKIFDYQRTYLYSNEEMPVFTNVINTPYGPTYDFDGNETNEKAIAPQNAEVKLSNDYFISETLFSTEEISALFIAKDGYDILLALGGANSAEPIIIDWYAEKALAIGDGRVLIYTPEGYGLLLIDLN